ncbi:tyrosine-protein phosphatase [Rhodococcus erythropolis]|uniref:tyrosine-protein phosphatase n=1 Tax=Rhodococcus erythropolis TaxID=1833 RepID=UPI00294A0629|nr:tyrosine-protein phosphatase [Rhodococcus erythropolis]MDV6273905.1 tyrosine-protein phosphatase [Rhodococcus erythropolis]
MSNRIARPAATLLCAAILACVPVPALAGGIPALEQAGPAAAQATADRSLHLAGASNARDIGGYLTEDGHTVRWGKVFRSNALDKLTPTDLSSLSERGVESVDDFRTVVERTLSQDRIPDGARSSWFDVIGTNPANLPALVDMPTMYSLMVTDPGASRAFHDALANVANSDGAVLYHCSAGKDRTGWMTAVLLTLLGVSRADVNADYMLSNQYLTGPRTGSAFIDGVEQSWLDTSFATVDRVYGDFDNYVRDGLQLSEGDIAQLAHTLLI